VAAADAAAESHHQDCEGTHDQSPKVSSSHGHHPGSLISI
jgi:hypothetical protein